MVPANSNRHGVHAGPARFMQGQDVIGIVLQIAIIQGLGGVDMLKFGPVHVNPDVGAFVVVFAVVVVQRVYLPATGTI